MLKLKLLSLELLQLSLPLPLLFPFLLLGNGQLLIPDLPELGELLLLLHVCLLLGLFPIELLLPAPFNLLEHLQSPSLLFHEEFVRLLLCVRHLLVQDFVVSVFQLGQVLDLLVDHPLPRFLLFFELLLFLVLPEFIHGQFLLRVLLDFLLVLKLLEFFLFLNPSQLGVGYFEALLLLLEGQSSLALFLLFLFQLLLDLSLDQFALKLFVLDSLDNTHLEVSKLVGDILLVFHFLFVFQSEFFPDLLVVLLHLLFFKVLPLLLNILGHLLLFLVDLLLELPFLLDVGHKHLGLESLNLVLLLVKNPIGPLQSFRSQLGLERVFLSIDLPPLNFFFLKFSNAVLFSLSSHSFNRVRPILDPLLAHPLELLALHRSGGGLVEFIHSAGVFNPLQFVQSNYNFVFLDTGAHSAGSHT